MKATGAASATGGWEAEKRAPYSSDSSERCFTNEGGLGRDSLTGGDGADIFILNAGDSPATGSPLAYDTLNDFATGFDRIDLDTITGAGLVASAYAEVAIGSNGFNAATSVMTTARTRWCLWPAAPMAGCCGTPTATCTRPTGPSAWSPRTASDRTDLM